MNMITVTLNGAVTTCASGSTAMQVCERDGLYVPHLCHNKDLSPHGSCRLCIVEINQRVRIACATPLNDGDVINTETAQIQGMRLRLTQLLFTEGNHFCPSCELSGNCQLQAMAYHVGMMDGHFDHAFPARQVDATHETLIIDRDRCIACALCVRASREKDHKQVFALEGRGPATTIMPHSASGKLADSALRAQDAACHICPTGALLLREKPYAHAIGERLYDEHDIAEQGNLRPEYLDAIAGEGQP